MPSPPTHELDALLAHAGWMRRLARGLARDPSLADDVVQETWLAALEHAPPAGAPVRAWLATVVRNFALQHRRSDARRVRREELGARMEAQPSAHEAVTGLALQQDLARRVLALAEPYRSTLYQRYYEGLPPREIARRADVPVKTVKTRLTRALALLRAELDAAHGGDRSAWLSALVPFLGREPAAALYVGAVLMNLKLVLVLVGLAVCAVLSLAVWQLAPESRGEDALALDTERRDELVAPPQPGAVLANEAEVARRAEAEPARDASVSGVATAARPARISGRVLDVVGAPVPDVDIALDGEWDARAARFRAEPHVLARTQADGTFELDVISGAMTLTVAHPDWTTVRSARHYGGQDYARSTIIAVRRNPLAGIVSDRDGATVAAAEIWIEDAGEWARELGIALDNTLYVHWKTVSDSAGRFTLPDAPRLAGKLVVRSPNYEPFEMSLPDAPAPDLVVTLTPLERPHVLIRGTVVDAEDKPVAGAHVAIGYRLQLTAEDGAFHFDLTDKVSGGNWSKKRDDGVWVPDDDLAELRAVKAGQLPARHRLPAFEELERSPPAPIRLRLGGEPLTIRGHVLDHDGAPIAGVEVEVTTLTPFGQRRNPLERGGATWLLSFEPLMNGHDELGEPVSTAEDGTFELRGLLERDYDVFVHDTRTLRRAAVKAVHAGARDVEVRLPAAKDLKRVAGRVVGKNGDPVAGVDVRAGFQVPDSFARTTKAARTDEQGRFAFDALSAEGLGFQLVGDHIFIVFWRELDAGEDVGALELVVSRRAFVQLDLKGRAGFADHFSAVDARGDACRMMQFEDTAIFFPERAAIDAEKTPVVAVEEDTRTIVLWKDDKEVARVPVKVVADETVIVKP